MSVTENDILRKVRQWLQYADEDLLLARHALTLKSTAPYRLIAYHAQQCAEKHPKKPTWSFIVSTFPLRTTCPD